MLKAKQPETIQKRLKALFYGTAGVGKTMAAIQFPNAYVIDTERGAENYQYTKILEKNNSVIFQSNDFNEIMGELRSLSIEKHSYKTIIIDSLTTVYNLLLQKISEKTKTSKYGAHFAETAKFMEDMIRVLLKLDMNVIITCHSKNEYGENMSVLGQTFDGYKKLDYLFDLVLEIKKEDKKRIAVIKKSRIQSFEETGKFEFSYQAILTRYNKDIIEKESEVIIPKEPKKIEIKEEETQQIEVKEEEKNVGLSSEVQLKQFYDLLLHLEIPSERRNKWLERANVSSFNEMKYSDMQKLLEHLYKETKE